MKFNLEIIAKLVDIPGMVFACPMAWKVDRGYICDSFCIDAESLVFPLSVNAAAQSLKGK